MRPVVYVETTILSYLASAPSFLKVIDEAQKQSFRNTVVTQMLALTRQADGTCFETLRRVNLLAHK